MLNKRYIELAASKAATDEELAVLRPIIAIASELDEQDRTFEARINASKAARGESPTKLSKAKRQEVDQYAADEMEIADKQLKVFESFSSAHPIIFALHMGLETDVKFWSKAHLKAHPSDSAILHEFTRAKVKLLDALAAYLLQFQDNDFQIHPFP